ncbi:hypothetical protein EV121DRAFT_195203 [Schizophyllum commune]
MHLIFENVVKHLISLWTGGIDGVRGDFQFEKLSVWQGVGEATEGSGRHIPSVFGARPPNCAEPKGAATADTWSFWLLYLGPVHLTKCFRRKEFYTHFVRLAELVNECLLFQSSRQQVGEIREGFIEWVNVFERIYYEHNPAHLPACTLNIHALLHIADSIEAMGPVWTYWAFPMERFCGRLQSSLRSRRDPWSNLNERVVAVARLDQIKLKYGLDDELSLRRTHTAMPSGHFRHPRYPTCILLPRTRSTVEEAELDKINIHLQTRYGVRHRIIRKYLSANNVKQYAGIRRLADGDDMFAASMVRETEDYRDATFVKYDLLVDQHADDLNAEEEFVAQAFYGQLKHIFLVTLPAAARKDLDCSDDDNAEEETGEDPIILFLAGIQTCNTEDDPEIPNPVYTTMGRYEVVDVHSIECLIGRTPRKGSRHRWAIIDRSSAINRSIYIPDTM